MEASRTLPSLKCSKRNVVRVSRLTVHDCGCCRVNPGATVIFPGRRRKCRESERARERQQAIGSAYSTSVQRRRTKSPDEIGATWEPEGKTLRLPGTVHLDLGSELNESVSVTKSGQDCKSSWSGSALISESHAPLSLRSCPPENRGLLPGAPAARVRHISAPSHVRGETAESIEHGERREWRRQVLRG